MKRFISLLLVLVMLCTMGGFAQADSGPETTGIKKSISCISPESMQVSMYVNKGS